MRHIVVHTLLTIMSPGTDELVSLVKGTTAYMSHTHVTSARKPSMPLCVKSILRCQPDIVIEAICKRSQDCCWFVVPRPGLEEDRSRFRLPRHGCMAQILRFMPKKYFQRAGVVLDCEFQSPQTDSCAVVSLVRLIPPSSTLHPSLSSCLRRGECIFRQAPESRSTRSGGYLNKSEDSAERENC